MVSHPVPIMLYLYICGTPMHSYKWSFSFMFNTNFNQIMIGNTSSLHVFIAIDDISMYIQIGTYIYNECSRSDPKKQTAEHWLKRITTRYTMTERYFDGSLSYYDNLLGNFTARRTYRKPLRFTTKLLKSHLKSMNCQVYLLLQFLL